MSPTGSRELPVDRQSPAAKVCDIVRYAPLAILLDGPSLLPQLAEQGKQHMRNARALGPVALRRVERHLRANFGDLGTQAAALLRATGLVTVRADGGSDGDGAGSGDGAGAGDRADGRDRGVADARSGRSATVNGDGKGARESGADGRGRAVPTTTAGPAATAEPVPGPAADALAIPDYDSLSAMQVVNRLPGLAADELAAVRDYEAGHRHRKTILNRIAQLQEAQR